MHHERNHFPAQYSNRSGYISLVANYLWNRDFSLNAAPSVNFFIRNNNKQFSFFLSFYSILFYFFFFSSPPSFRCHFVPCDIIILVSCAALAESRCWYLQTKLCTSFLNKYEVYMKFVSSYFLLYHIVPEDICYFCSFIFVILIHKIK